MTPADRARTRIGLGLDAHTPVIGFVGRITPDKGFTDLISAAGLMAKRGASFQLLIVGAEDEVGYLSSVQRELASLGVASAFPGYVAQPELLYGAMDVFVLPSRREGMPNVSLEAAAHGVPVVTTDSTGCVDSVVNEVTGHVYRAGDFERLAHHLISFMEDPVEAHKFGARGRKWVAEHFDRPQVWQQYEEFFLQLP